MITAERLSNRLSHILEARLDALTLLLTDGIVQDFERFQALRGEIRGLRYAISELNGQMDPERLAELFKDGHDHDDLDL